MVDLSTAMTAAQGERRQRTQGGDKEKKVRRTGRNLGIEAFDPVKHVQKEKADTASMWLVLAIRVDGFHRPGEFQNFVHSSSNVHFLDSNASSYCYAGTIC